MDRIDCLSAFVRVMESGSFSSAAHELGVGQPAISKRIALLEQEFATQLFLRSTRKLKPTAEAHRVYDLARQLLNSFEQARSSVIDASPRPSGTLRLSVPSSFGRRYIMPIVADYLRDNPDLRIDIRFSERMIDLIEEGVELALHVGPLVSSSFVARRIGTVRHYLVATPDYLRHRPYPRTPDDLHDHVCIAYSRTPNADQWEFESELGRHVVQIAAAITVDDVDAMKEAVLQHLGLAILPAWSVVDAVADGKMEIVLTDYAVPASALHAVYPETRWISLRARSFLDVLVARSNQLNRMLAIPQ
jgi:DNA-binding transcriptional LysR family regulator